MEDFQKWIDSLDKKGYSSFWQDLNAKDFGVAQNRVRCFMVSLLGDYTYEFPKPIPLTKTMKDYLEEEVDEKYYINNEKAQKLIDKLIDDGTIPAEQTCVDLTINNQREIKAANCIKARYDAGISNFKSDGSGVVEINKIGFLEKGTGEHQSNQVFDKEGICPCVYAGVWKEPFKILE